MNAEFSLPDSPVCRYLFLLIHLSSWRDFVLRVRHSSFESAPTQSIGSGTIDTVRRVL